MITFFTRMNMATKLFISPFVCLFFLVISGAVSFWGMRMQQSTIQEMKSVRFANYAKVGNIMNDTDSIHTNLYQLITRSNAGFDKKKLEEDIKAAQGNLGKITTTIKALSEDASLKADEKKFASDILASFTEYSKNAQDMLDMLESDVNAATMYMQQADDKYAILEQKTVVF